MEDREFESYPRTEQFLNTVALGSMMVFASVMPSLTPDDDMALFESIDSDDMQDIQALGGTDTAMSDI